MVLELRPDGSAEGRDFPVLEIYTLGRFEVQGAEGRPFEALRRSPRLRQLFIQLLLREDREVPAETLVHRLWERGQIAHPLAALQGLVYRLRWAFDGLPGAGGPPVRIEYDQVGYRLRLGEGAWYDAREFFRCVRAAASLGSTEPGAAIDAGRRALSLYGGAFLPGWSGDPAVIPERRRCRRAYLDTLRLVIGLLHREARYGEMVAAGEAAFSVEMFLDVEDIHGWFMEALARGGRRDEALEHFAAVSRALATDRGRRPPPRLQEAHRIIRESGGWPEDERLDLDAICHRMMGSDDGEGASLLDRESFSFALQLLSRQREAGSGNPSYLGLFSIAAADGGRPPGGILGRAAETLEGVLRTHLRRGDALSRWNEAQYLALLPRAHALVPGDFCRRIEAAFRRSFGTGDAAVLCQFRAVGGPRHRPEDRARGARASSDHRLFLSTARAEEPPLPDGPPVLPRESP